VQECQKWQHHQVQYPRLCGQMPWSTMEVSQHRKLYIRYKALQVCLLYIAKLVDKWLPQCGFTLIVLHAASYTTCIKCYKAFSSVRSGSNFGWLLWQCCGGLTVVCIVAVYQWVVHWMKWLVFDLIKNGSHCSEVFVKSWFAGVEKVRKKIMKGSGMSRGIYS